MDPAAAQSGTVTLRVANALVALHKEQFGRGPTFARADFAGPNAMLCVLEEALLPAERRLVELGDPTRVRETRAAFQAATAKEFVGVVEDIVGRRVRAFASAVDPEAGVVFECFVFEQGPATYDGRGPDGA